MKLIVSYKFCTLHSYEVVNVNTLYNKWTSGLLSLHMHCQLLSSLCELKFWKVMSTLSVANHLCWFIAVKFLVQKVCVLATTARSSLKLKIFPVC